MTDYTELKRLAEHHLSLGHAYTVATPSAVLALIAENERLLKLLERTVEQHVPLTELEDVPGWSRVVELVEVVTERDQLRAEVAGLRTGYEAYEQVNAELKAENERIERNRDMWKGQVDRQCETIEDLRKALKTAEDAMWHADGNMDGEAADARDALAALGQGEQS